MRLFFALLPDSNTSDRLTRAAADLKISADARLLAPENHHVTLAFIGEVRDGEVGLYREIGGALHVPHCAIELNTCEYWPSSQAVVLAARENPLPIAATAERLRAAVAERISSRGAERGWRAHATLARKVTQAPVLTAMSSVSWISRSFALMRSATGGRAVYTVVDSWSVLDKR